MSDIKLSPFYHSAVNAVTKPNKLAAVSHYFIDRWMPILGGNGTLIVLALRRDGFLNRKTGELRDEIVIGRAELAAAAGMSEDTLTREMGVNRKTGRPQNEWLHLFVQKRTRNRRDRLGRVWREESAYWVAMDDPIHPDDWPLVEQAVRDAEERMEKQPPPRTQSAFSVGGPTPQGASSIPQSAVLTPHSAGPTPQSASAHKTLDSSSHEQTLLDAASPPEGSASLSGGEGKELPVRAAQRALDAAQSPFAIARRQGRAKKGDAWGEEQAQQHQEAQQDSLRPE